MKNSVPSVPVKVFIGYDHVEGESWYVAAQSIFKHSSVPVSVTPIRLSHLDGLMWRDRDPMQSNEFAFSRWLVPHLCNYEGWALFIDTDMMFRTDIAELFALRDWRYAIQVVQHQPYVPKEQKKFLNTKQTAYERKNWSSVMLFNNARCRKLTPEFVNKASGLELHQLRWLDDHEIGEIPRQWNHLVGVYDHDPDAKNVHWTIVGPWFECAREADYANEYRAMKADMLNVQEFVPEDSSIIPKSAR